MRIAVTDACIFIDLIDLKITSQFFGLKLEVHTTISVWNELNSPQQELLNAYQSVNKLTVHILESDELEEIRELKYPNRLSAQDQSVLYLAKKLDALILSSDKPVRNLAKSQSIDCHGMFWVLDQLIEQALLSEKMAALKLRSLLMGNLMYRDNVMLWKEANKRFKIWEK